MSYKNKVPHRAEVIIRLIRENGYKNIAEIGVRDGETAMMITMLCNLDLYLAVDIRRNNILKEWMGKRKKKCFNYKIMSSLEASSKVPDKSLDLVFIDADHSFDTVIEDITVWLPKIREGGIISGHDYDELEFEGVFKAVNGLLGDVETEIDTVSTTWWKKI